MTKFILGIIAGLFVGTIGLVIVFVVCLAIAFTQNTHIVLPGLFEAWRATVDGMGQIRFLPNLAGIGVTLAIWSLLCGILATRIGRRSGSSGTSARVHAAQ